MEAFRAWMSELGLGGFSVFGWVWYYGAFWSGELGWVAVLRWRFGLFLDWCV